MLEDDDLIIDDMPAEAEALFPPALEGRRARGSLAMACALSILVHSAGAAAAALLLKHHFVPPAIALSWGVAGSGDAGQSAAGGDESTPPQSAPVSLPEELAGVEAAVIDASALGGMPACPSVIGIGAAVFPAALGGENDGPLVGLPSTMGEGPIFNSRVPVLASTSGEVSGGASANAVSRGHGQGGSGAVGGGFKSLPQPIYPRECRQRGEQGRVVLLVEILASGELGSIEILDDSGHPLLAESAIAAIRHASITRATLDGEAVAVKIKVPFEFVLR